METPDIESLTRKPRSNGVSYRWVMLGLITLTHVMSAYSGQSIQPLAPFLQSELHLKHVQIGMFTSVFFLGAFLLSIPMGWLVDRVGVYWAMAIGQLIIGSFILSIGFANSFSMVCGFLLLAGMGHGAINPATGKAVMSWFSIKGRATAMGVKQTGIPMGGVLAAATLPSLALALDWRKAFIIAGTISLLSVLLCLLFYRESHLEEKHDKLQPLRFSSLLEIFKKTGI